MSYSLLDKSNIYLYFGARIGDFEELARLIDNMSPSMVEYYLSSMIIEYDVFGEDLDYNYTIQVGDYVIYRSFNEDLYLKSIKNGSSYFEGDSLFS